MKILLVQSWLGRDQHPVLPLGLACIAASLDGYPVRIADPNVHENPLEYLKGVLRDFEPDAVGLSLRNCDTTSYRDRYSYLQAFIRQTEMVRNEVPGAYIMAGGAGFSIFAREIKNACPSLDCGVKGHGEEVVRGLVENRSEGIKKGFAGSFREPRLDLLDANAYIPFQKNLSIGVEVNRGCHLRCSYCSYGEISGRRVRERNTESVLREVGFHAGRGVRHLFLVAPVLNSTRRRGEEIARAMASSGVPVTWEAYHSPKDFDDPYAAMVSASGCTGVSFSPDGGTERQMRLMGKDYSMEQLENAVISASCAGLDISINLFPWRPETGISGMFQAFNNGSRWGRLAGSRLKRLRFSLVRRMPGTPFGPASAFLARKEFDRPSGAGMPVFLILSRLCERDRT